MRTPTRAVALACVLAAGCSLFDRAPEPEPAAEAFLEGWRTGELDPALLTDPAVAAPAGELLAATAQELGEDPQLALRTVETVEESTTAQVAVTWPLPSGPWTYDTAVPLVLGEGGWRVAWSPAVLHPQLADGQTVDLRGAPPERASILAANGEPLFVRRPVVTVGIEPQRVTDLERTLAVLVDTLQVEPDPLRERVQAAAPDQFVEVVTLRREEYDPLRATLQPLPGTVFQEGERVLAPNRTFARALLGRVGPPTEELLAEAGPGFGPGEQLGLSGLQRQFQAQLAGQPGTQVVAVDTQSVDAGVLHETVPIPGEPLATTLVAEVQNAAEAAVDGVASPSALVALRTTTGEVLAVANGPDGGSANTAFTGQYAPGSTFKVVSTAALLANGLTADQPVECPPTATVGGRSFRNAEGNAAGQVTYREAFAESCNTTIAPLATALPEGAVAAAAEGFGLGGAWNPGIEAYTGQAPPPADDVERAAEAIGQGRVLASPLGMAAVAAAVADGAWRPPILLPAHAEADAGPRPLDPAAVATLRDLMRAVVTSGTGSALAGVPGAPVAGKSGTAEFGEQVPPRTHAWFIGYRGDVAMAVLVEDGGGGGAVAGPIAARFFSALP